MVRRILLTAFLAALAVALPAAAEGDDPFGIPAGPDPGCLPADLGCAVDTDPLPCDPWLGPCPADMADDSAAVSLAQRVEAPACRAWDMNLPDSSQPIDETLIFDPDGCIRSFLRRTLGWPPLLDAIELNGLDASGPSFASLPWT